MSLQKIELFTGMSEGFVKELNSIKVEESCERGTFLFKEGEQAQHFYILEQGRIRLSVGERSHIVYTLSSPGDIFGWSSLVSLDDYTASAECTSPAKLIKFEKSLLNNILEQHPSDGLKFFRRLSRLIGQRLINIYNWSVSGQSQESIPSYG